MADDPPQPAGSFDAGHGFKQSASDSELEGLIERHCAEHDLTALDGVKLFPVLARRQWLKRFLSHVEFFKMSLDVPGDIAELGVYRGLGLMTWANLLEAYAIGNRSKTVYGFDNWRGFGRLSPEDGQEIEDAGKQAGGFSPGRFRQELESAISIFDSDRFIPRKPRIKLIDGNIEETVPAFVRDNDGVRFSLVHFDCDLYAPTKAALEALWPAISRGGIVLFDEYGIPDWPGETKAVDEFLADHPEVQLRTQSWTNAPAAYLIRP